MLQRLTKKSARPAAAGCHQTKCVVAHFMVGNTYPYTKQDWKEDIKLANRHGIDAFALNVGKEDWQRARVADCFDAAAELCNPFKLFLSFDMTSIAADNESDITLLLDYFSSFARHPSHLVCRGKALVSTFAGENSLFGRSSLDDAWSFVKSTLEQVVPVHFVPAFFISPAHLTKLRSIDGYFNWNGSWPIHLTPQSLREEVECAKLETDRAYIHHLGERTYMAAVSPWFSTHYGPDSWNKNWIYRGDDWLFARRWEQLIAMHDQVDIVQIISWNDYGESHYIGPIKGAQPNSEAWVNGFPHEALLPLNAHYARAFKGAQSPYETVDADRIFMWARPHLKDVRAPDHVDRPANWELTDDVFWVVVFATEPSVLTLSSDFDQTDRRAMEVSAGITKLSHPMYPTGSMRAAMSREGVVIVDCCPDNDGFAFQVEPETYNYNIFSAMSQQSI